MKRCFTSHIIKEKQIKTTRYHTHLLEIVKIQNTDNLIQNTGNTDNTKCWQGYEATETLMQYWLLLLISFSEILFPLLPSLQPVSIFRFLLLKNNAPSPVVSLFQNNLEKQSSLAVATTLFLIYFLLYCIQIFALHPTSIRFFFYHFK